MERCSALLTGAARSRCLLLMLLIFSALWAIFSMISWRHHVSDSSRMYAKCVGLASSVSPAIIQQESMLAKGCETRQQTTDAARAGTTRCHSNVQPPVKAAPCNPHLLPTPEQVSDMFTERWGKSCLPLRKACIDQGTVIVYQPLPDGTWPINTFQLDFNHLDFRGFGDSIGIISYPNPIVRPGTEDEETADLRRPVFSNCSRPVVLYHNHLYMFGDFMIRLMPAYINAIKAAAWPENLPAWDPRLTLVLATGGQRLARWQKLMMAPLSQYPITTLSAASSRAIPLQAPQQHLHQRPAQHGVAAESADASTRRRVPLVRQLQQVNTGSESKTKPPSLTTIAMPAERCFESLTLCGMNSPRGFPGSTDRPVWAGAQFIKNFWMKHYGSAYSHLLPHQQVLQEPAAFRVVFAIRSAAETTGTVNYSQSVRMITNLPHVLQWCNSWRPVTPDGAPHPRFSHTVCIAHEFGRHGQVLTQPLEPHGPAASANQKHRRLRQQQQQQQQHDLAEAAGHSLAGFTNTFAAKAAAAAMVTAAGPAPAASHVAPASGGALGVSARPAEPAQQQQSDDQDDLPADPELDPRALLQDFAVLDHTDVLVGLHGAQLMNAFFMPAHKSLIEIRPYNFNLGWPGMYFSEPMVRDDRGEGIFWFGVNTVQSNNSQPGMWEATSRGCCYERDRHTRIESNALDYLFRRIIDVQEDPARYGELRQREDHFITDSLQPGLEYERQVLAAVKKRQQEQEEQQRQQQQNNPG